MFPPPPSKKINKTELPQKKLAHHPLKKLELPEIKKSQPLVKNLQSLLKKSQILTPQQ